VERFVAAPYVKDYDTIDGDSPGAWPRRFDLSKWVAFLARANDRMVGAIAVAFDTPQVEMLEGRRDLAVLWDVRVAPTARGQGVGAALVWKRSRRSAERRSRGYASKAAAMTEGSGCAQCRDPRSRHGGNARSLPT